MNDWIKLDVGGTKFKTTRGTLTSSQESLLSKMFDPDSERPPAPLSEDGHYLIDACPRAFAVILNWLRYREIIGKEIYPEDVIPVADYFGLPELCEKLETLKKPVTENNNEGDIIRLNVGGTIFETTRATLTAHPHTEIARMFSPGSQTSPLLTKDGSYFIDACPKSAEVVLNWIRRASEEEHVYVGKLYGTFNIPADVNETYLAKTAKIFRLLVRYEIVEEMDCVVYSFI